MNVIFKDGIIYSLSFLRESVNKMPNVKPANGKPKTNINNELRILLENLREIKTFIKIKARVIKRYFFLFSIKNEIIQFLFLSLLV